MLPLICVKGVLNVKHMGVWVRWALLAIVLFLMCSFAAAEEAGLEILSCEQQGKSVVLEFVCLDESNMPVELPLDSAAWTVRGTSQLTDLQVDSVIRKQDGTHFVILFESSASVTETYSLSKTIAALKTAASNLKPQDSMSLVQIGGGAELKINRSSDQDAIKNALGNIKTESSVQNVLLYDSVNQALGMISRRNGERTVLIILATGYDKGSVLTKYELAQRLEDANVSVYAILVNGHDTKENADNLEALCVRGGFLIHAEKQTNKQQMESTLSELMPVARETYVLQAHANDASYNNLNGVKLRVFTYQGEKKIGGEALLTTDGELFVPVVTATPAPTAPTAPTATPVPDPVPDPVAETVTFTPAPTEYVTMPAPTEIAPEEEAPAPVQESKTMMYLIGGGVAMIVIAAIVAAVLLVRGSKKKKAEKKQAERPAAQINHQFSPQMPGEQKSAPAPAVKTEAPATPASDEPRKPEAPVVKPEPEPSAPARTTAVPAAEEPVVQPLVMPATAHQTPTLDKTMDEHQARNQEPTLDKTMDERQAYNQEPALDKTMDERQARNQAPVLDKTMDERQAYRPATPSAGTAAVGSAQLEAMLAPVPAADQTVIPVSRDPQLILTITDANGTREVSAPLVTGGEITVGRENTDVLLDENDHSISRNHLSIRMTASRLEAEDHSGNGTVVDGRRVHRSTVKLTIGSVLEMGGLDEAMENRVKTVIRVKGFQHPGGR